MTWLSEKSVRCVPVPVRAPHKGVLAPDSAGSWPGFVPVTGTSPGGEDDGIVRAWLTAEPVPDPHRSWHGWAADFDRSGLWPLLVMQAWDRPFRSGELDEPAGSADAPDVLRSGWEGTRLVQQDGTLLPHPPWPGLAEPADGSGDESAAMIGLPDEGLPRELLLVPAARPADALAQLGWRGACNWSLTGADIAGVLRSWEDRFGAYVVGIGFATLDLVVTRPPTTEEQCLLLADEHYAFCPDNFFPQNLPPAPTAITREEYAGALCDASVWHFWWD